MIPDIERVSRLIEEVAQDEVLPRFRALAAHEISEKSGPNDLVTAADIACEAKLSAALVEILPDSLVLGEEAAARDPSILDVLDEDGWIWIIDPVDGTYNFAHGREPFAVIVSLARAGQVVAGWIHDPLAGETITAEQGGGAYLNGRKLSVASPLPIKEMQSVLYVGKKRAPELYDRIMEVKDTLGPRNFARCVAAEYWGLATGEFHYAIFTLQLPWDHAAGCRIFEEAGGHLACIDGTPYRVKGSTTPLLLAPDRASWQELREHLAPFAIPS